MSQLAQQDLFHRAAQAAPPSVFDFEGLPSGDADGLRYYQREAYLCALRELETCRRVAVVMATGLGKTQLFGAVAKHWKGRVLILAHRQELVNQAASRLSQMTGELVGIEMADSRSRGERIVCGSVQTLRNEARRSRLSMFGEPTLVIVDELHHYVSATFRKTMEAFPNAKILGVTATPYRGDKLSVGQIVDKLAYSKDLPTGINEGWLVPLVGKSVYLEQVDLTHVKATAGDLSSGQLDEEMMKGVEGVITKLLELAGDRRGPVFFPGKSSARLATERLNVMRPGCARLLTDDTPQKEREAIMREIAAGSVQYLCNVLVASEGFDWPAASVVGMARPTKSAVIIAQMVGRGTRTLTGTIDGLDDLWLAPARKDAIAKSPKPDCLLLDFVGNAGKHDLVSPVDLFAGDYTPAEVKKAKLLEKASGGNPQELLEKARAELRKLAAAMRSKVQARVEAFDVFSALNIDRDASERNDLRHGYEPATAAQLEALRDTGMDLTGLSKHDAAAALTTLRWRRVKGLATPKQLKALRKFGWAGNQVTFDAARKMLDYCANLNWAKDRIQLQQLEALSK